MKYLNILLCFIALSFVSSQAKIIEIAPANAGPMMLQIAGGQTVVSGASCPADGSPDIIDGVNGGDTTTLNNGSDTEYYVGGFWTPGVTKSICKIGFLLNYREGNVETDIYAGIYEIVNGDDLDSSVITNGLSAAVTGSSGWSSTWVYFDFSGNPEVSASTQYGVVIYSAGMDNDNNISVQSEGSEGSVVFEFTKCKLSNSDCRDDWPNDSVSIKVFYYD